MSTDPTLQYSSSTMDSKAAVTVPGTVPAAQQQPLTAVPDGTTDGYDSTALPPPTRTEAVPHQATSSTNPPTIGFIIPFPEYTGPALHSEGEDTKKAKTTSDDIPPFIIYHPPLARLNKPGEGEKESLVNKAVRKWQEEEDDARGKKGIKAKTVNLIGKGMSMTKNSGIEFLTRTPKEEKLGEIRLLYPESYPQDTLKEDFTKLIKQTKKGAKKSSVIATALTPFALAFDTVTFIPGPFEVCCVWASSSWVGTARASSIANGVTSDKVPLNFAASSKLSPLAVRLHEIVAHHVPRSSVGPTQHAGDGVPKRGPELASIILDLVREQVPGEDIAEIYDTDRMRVAEDIEDILQKAAKEWAKVVKTVEKK